MGSSNKYPGPDFWRVSSYNPETGEPITQSDYSTYEESNQTFQQLLMYAQEVILKLSLCFETEIDTVRERQVIKYWSPVPDQPKSHWW